MTPSSQPPAELPPFDKWLAKVSPGYNWQWDYLTYIIARLNDVTAGKIKKLMLFIPPRHGKSSLATIRYPVYRLAANPSLRVIIGAYNQDLAASFGRATRRLARPRLELSVDRQTASDWETEAGGGVRSVGVGVGVTGRGGDLIVMDDPVKSRAEVESRRYRDLVYDWYTNDIYTRLEPGGAIVLIMTRWHFDDLAGRILASNDGPNWQVIRLPAEAEPGDPLGRPEGAALCPARFNVTQLASIKKVLMSDYSALYQQAPIARQGAFFDRSWFDIIPAGPAAGRLVRYWDKAASLSGDYTVGVLILEAAGIYYVMDVVRGQWSTFERENVIKSTAQLDAARYGQFSVSIWVEVEGGSGGLDSMAATVRNLAGYPIFGEHPTGSKTARAEPLAAQLQAKNVKLVSGPWVEDFILEATEFPRGAHDDQIDAASGALNKLTIGAGGGSPDAWLEAYKNDKPDDGGDPLARPTGWAPPVVMG